MIHIQTAYKLEGKIRKQREWYPGACYHIMQRGIRRMELFGESFHYEIFLLLLRKALERYGGVLHAYFLQTSRYIHLNPVKAGMVAHPEDYRWSSYCTMIGLTDDRLTETNKTLAYFKSPNKMRYREFVEDIGHKYVVDEEIIRKEMGENEIWLPW